MEIKPGRPYEIPGKDREDLAKWFNELGFTKGAEIGVLWGRYSKQLCDHNPNLKLYCIDPWLEHSDYHDAHCPQDRMESLYEQTKELLKDSNCVIIRKKSMDALADFEDESLDFVYIDGNHQFTSEANDIHEWSKKVRKGGIIAGHDYRRYKPSSLSHSYQVVRAYTDAYDIDYCVLGLKGEKDRIRSWFWIK